MYIILCHNMSFIKYNPIIMYQKEIVDASTTILVLEACVQRRIITIIPYLPKHERHPWEYHTKSTP